MVSSVLRASACLMGQIFAIDGDEDKPERKLSSRDAGIIMRDPRDAQREVSSFRSPRLSRNQGAEAERMRGWPTEHDSLPRRASR
jgi:hypothetical protein